MTDHKRTTREQVTYWAELLLERYGASTERVEAADKEHAAEVARLKAEVAALERIRTELGEEIEDLALEVENVTAERNQALDAIIRLRAAQDAPNEPTPEAPDGS